MLLPITLSTLTSIVVFLPVILMSGYAEVTVEREVSALAGAVFIHKPPRPQELVVAVRTLLGR